MSSPSKTPKVVKDESNALDWVEQNCQDDELKYNIKNFIGLARIPKKGWSFDELWWNLFRFGQFCTPGPAGSLPQVIDRMVDEKMIRKDEKGRYHYE